MLIYSFRGLLCRSCRGKKWGLRRFIEVEDEQQLATQKVQAPAQTVAPAAPMAPAQMGSSDSPGADSDSDTDDMADDPDEHPRSEHSGRAPRGQRIVADSLDDPPPLKEGTEPFRRVTKLVTHPLVPEPGGEQPERRQHPLCR